MSGLSRSLSELNRLAQVAQVCIQRMNKGMNQGRLAAAGDDDAFSAMGPKIGGHRADPPRIKRDRGLE